MEFIIIMHLALILKYVQILTWRTVITSKWLSLSSVDLVVPIVKLIRL